MINLLSILNSPLLLVHLKATIYQTIPENIQEITLRAVIMKWMSSVRFPVLDPAP